MQFPRQKINDFIKELKLALFERKAHERYLLWALLTFSIVCLYSSVSFAFSSIQNWKFTNQRANLLRTLSDKKEIQKKTIEAHAIKYRHSDLHYLSSIVTAQQLIVSEAKKAEILIKEKEGDLSSSLQLDEILLNQSRFHFSEKSRRSYNEGDEIEWAMDCPVLMNEDDLKKILSLVEGVSLGKNRTPAKRPLLLVKTFELEQVELPFRDRVYRVRMELIQRTFSQQGRSKSST